MAIFNCYVSSPEGSHYNPHCQSIPPIPPMYLQVALGSRWLWALAASRTTRLGGSAVCTVHVLLHLWYMMYILYYIIYGIYFMYVYYTYIYIYIHTYIWYYICGYIYIYILYTCGHINIFTHYRCMSVCKYIYVYIYTHLAKLTLHIFCQAEWFWRWDHHHFWAAVRRITRTRIKLFWQKGKTVVANHR